MLLDRDLFDFFEHAADAVFTVTVHPRIFGDATPISRVAA